MVVWPQDIPSALQKQIDELYELFKKETLIPGFHQNLEEKLPDILGRLPLKDRQATLEMTIQITKRNRIDAMTFLEKMPDIFNQIDSRGKKYLQAILKQTAGKGKYCLSLFENAPAILHDLPKQYHPEVLRATLDLSVTDPNVAYWFFKHAPEILKTPEHYPEYKRTSEIIARTSKTGGFFRHSAGFIQEFPEHYPAYAEIAQGVPDKDIAHLVLKDAKDVLKQTSPERRPFMLEALKKLSDNTWYHEYAFFSGLADVMKKTDPEYAVPLLSYFVKARERIRASNDSSNNADIDVFKNAPEVIDRMKKEHGPQGVAYMLGLMEKTLEKDPGAARDLFINAPALLSNKTPQAGQEGLRQYGDVLQRLSEPDRKAFTKLLTHARPGHDQPIMDAIDLLSSSSVKRAHEMLGCLPAVLKGIRDDFILDRDYLLIQTIKDQESAHFVYEHIDKNKHGKEYAERVKVFY